MGEIEVNPIEDRLVAFTDEQGTHLYNEKGESSR
jgi:hypothetical protein